MEFSTIAPSGADYKQGSLPVALYPNRMRQSSDGHLTYFARIICRGTCTNEDIVNDVMANGLNGDLSKEQLLNIVMLLKNARLKRLADGYAVDDGITRTYAKVTGAFGSEFDTFSTERHGIDLRSYATTEAKAVLAELRPAIRQGTLAKPVITEIRDLESGKADTLTRGGFLDIRGANICVGGESEDVGLHFEHTEDSGKDVCLSAQKLGTNTASRIACVVPQELSEGSYRIRIVTQLTTGKLQRKDALSFLHETPLIVA